MMTKEKLEKISKLMLWVIPGMFLCMIGDYCLGIEPKESEHNLLHVLPLMCNSDFFGIEQIHGTLIRCGTCGNSEMCDYCVVGNKNPLADRYEIRTDEIGFLVSVEKEN